MEEYLTFSSVKHNLLSRKLNFSKSYLVLRSSIPGIEFLDTVPSNGLWKALQSNGQVTPSEKQT